MRPLTLGTSLAAVLFALGCEDKPATAPAAGRPQFAISDAGHGTGTPGFYFLPPMVAAPTFTGTFVSGLTLEVEICVWNGTACDALIATFSTNTGTGSETVRVDTENERYIVNWKTGQFHLDPAKTYRIRVLLGSTELGHADVDVVATGRERKSVNTAELTRSEEHTSELQSQFHLVCRLLLEKKKLAGMLGEPPAVSPGNAVWPCRTPRSLPC